MASGELPSRVGVLCGAAAAAREPYREFARELGIRLGRAGVGLVHGGVAAGLVGVAVRAVVTAGGEVISVVPHGLLRAEDGPIRRRQVHVVRTITDQQRMVHRLADGFVVLPGGLDTLDQFCAVVARNDMAKPVVVANQNGYFDPLLAQLDRAVAEAFVTPARRGAIESATTMDGVLRGLAARATSVDGQGVRGPREAAHGGWHVGRADQQAAVGGGDEALLGRLVDQPQ